MFFSDFLYSFTEAIHLLLILFVLTKLVNIKLFSRLFSSIFSTKLSTGRCVGKKTALLQAEASACVSGLANVQFCALAVHYIVFLFLSLSSKLSVRFSLFALTANVGYMQSRRLRASKLSKR